MADISGVNSQLLSTLEKTRSSVSAPNIVLENGAGKAFQFVAQAAAMAVQDATDNLRNVSTISTTAIGVAMAQLMTTGDVQTWGPVIQAARSLVQSSTDDYQMIGQSAAWVLRNFPPGPPASLERSVTEVKTGVRT